MAAGTSPCNPLAPSLLLHPLDRHARSFAGVGDHSGRPTKQHHEMLLNKKKADKKKKKVNAALNEWTLIVALDSIVLSSDSRSIISIDSKPVDAWNMKYLQGFAQSLKSQDTRMQDVT
jgi:hypothetical protein